MLYKLPKTLINDIIIKKHKENNISMKKYRPKTKGKRNINGLIFSKSLGKTL